MVVKYKLIMVEVEEGKIQPSHEICVIGTFDGEEALEQWVKENRGELRKC